MEDLIKSNYIQDKYLKYFYILIFIFIMYLIPFSVKGNASIYISIISIISIIGIIFRVKYAFFLLLSIVLCLPAGWAGTSGIVFKEVELMKISFDRFIIFFIPVIGIIQFYKEHFPKKNNVYLIVFCVFVLGVIMSLNRIDRSELRVILRCLGMCYGVFFVCYCEKNIKINDIFLYLDVLFIISFLYGIADFFFRQSPYQYITDATTSFNSIGRARGILGHPLYLSGLAVFYQAIIYIRYFIEKKFSYVQEALCLIMSLIVVSRTTIIVMMMEYLLFVVMTQGYKKIKFIIVNIFLIIIASYSMYLYANNTIVDIFSRFEEGSIGHRESSYYVVFDYFINNPFGGGYCDIMKELSTIGVSYRYYLSEFSTVDNLFLTHIAAYGIFAIIKFIFYFYFLYDSFKRRNKNPILFKVSLLLYFPLLMEAFSFDWDMSRFICMLHYGFLGYLYSYFLKTKTQLLNGLDNKTDIV